jgi:hypothetical protein
MWRWGRDVTAWLMITSSWLKIKWLPLLITILAVIIVYSYCSMFLNQEIFWRMYLVHCTARGCARAGVHDLLTGNCTRTWSDYRQQKLVIKRLPLKKWRSEVGQQQLAGQIPWGWWTPFSELPSKTTRLAFGLWTCGLAELIEVSRGH